MKLNIGDKAPSFNTYDSEKQPLNSESLIGQNILLLFFPAAFTSTCTIELCTMRDDILRYNNLKVRIIGMSTDSVYVLKKYKEDQQLNFTLASDYNKDISAAFGSLYETFNFGMKGVSKRAAFIIDENGIIQYAEVLDKSGDVPNFEAIITRLEKMAMKI